MSATIPKTPRAQSREDFIKRLFAVTLSVGIANQLSAILFSKVRTVSQFDWSVIPENWHALLLLLISLAIVVSSWEGYLEAIQRDPLDDQWRFFIDILLVFSYLLLELSSKFYDLWFLIHTVIFIEYFIWDIFRSQTITYKNRLLQSPKKIYERSMTVTVWWLVYFVVIFLMKQFLPYFERDFAFASIAIAAFLGVIFYRADKVKRWTWPVKIYFALVPIDFLVILESFKLF